SASANLRINRIQLTNCHLVYNDRSIPMLINAKGFNYTGTGDLNNAIFDLDSKLNIDALDFTFDKEEYLRDKKINAKLLTQINTNSLVLLFQRNDLNINNLKLDFTGALKFLSNGYALDFKALADDIKLYSLITALPPKYLQWLEQTKVKGNADLLFSLKGNYIASQNEKPNLVFNMNIRNGYVAYNKAAPASDVEFRLRTILPALNTDSLKIDIDTFAFKLGQDFFDAKLHTLGLLHPHIAAQIKANMDLDKLQNAIGFNTADIKGRFQLDVKVDGFLAMGETANGELAINEIPKFSAKASLSQGYFKMASLPQGIQNINFDIRAENKDGIYQHSQLRVDNINATALNNFVKGRVWIDNLIDYQMNADFHSKVNFGEIQKFIPMDSLFLAGQMILDVKANGKYLPEKKLFPTIQLGLDLQNGSVQTKYYPRPITNIQANIDITDPTGTAKDLSLALAPLKFYFEGKPFEVKILMRNMDNIQYDIAAKGELDFAKIYSVFAQKDINVSGFAKMDLKMQGTQSDAMSGRYNRLNNTGSLALNSLQVQHLGYLPKPFVLQQGIFTFRNDKFYFDQFKATYGKSDIGLKGYLSNVINYMFSNKEKLKGSFEFTSNYLLVDELMPKKGTVVDSTVIDTSGVFVVPANLNMTFTAKAKKIEFDGLKMEDFAGQMVIDSAQLKLNKTGFKMIGTSFNMDAVYKNEQTKKAYFAFAIQAQDFDVRRAYKEVKLFKEMAPAAASAQGVISIDYALKGKLDSTMSPVYPSLEGGGVLSVRNVKFKGFKLFNNASKESGKAELKDPDVKDVKLKTTVKNNIITLEKVKIKMAGFRLRVQGESDFDHRLRFKMRLGLPPLGIIGIPMTVSGTSENPKIKVGKEEQDELPEQDDEGEIPVDAPKAEAEKILIPKYPDGTNVLPNW
ncbi:MAG: hypothetical protein IT256_07480, partial [Chitinophagaceae bacterium]|nr:hypothetical protein [Chitinophagaceae bacterium]